MTFAKTNYYVLRIELKTADPVLSHAHAPVAKIEDALDGRRSWCPIHAVREWRTLIQVWLHPRIRSLVWAEQVDTDSKR